MTTYLIMMLIGLVVGFMGMIPLFRKRADKYFTFGSFLFYFMMPYVVYYLRFPFVVWWLKGAVITLILSLPLIISLGRGYKRCIFPMIITSILVGGIISVLEKVLL